MLQIKRIKISDDNYEKVGEAFDAIEQYKHEFDDAYASYEELDADDENFDEESDNIKGEMQDAYEKLVTEIEKLHKEGE